MHLLTDEEVLISTLFLLLISSKVSTKALLPPSISYIPPKIELSCVAMRKSRLINEPGDLGPKLEPSTASWAIRPCKRVFSKLSSNSSAIFSPIILANSLNFFFPSIRTFMPSLNNLK